MQRHLLSGYITTDSSSQLSLPRDSTFRIEGTAATIMALELHASQQVLVVSYKLIAAECTTIVSHRMRK